MVRLALAFGQGPGLREELAVAHDKQHVGRVLNRHGAGVVSIADCFMSQQQTPSFWNVNAFQCRCSQSWYDGEGRC